MKKIVRAIWWKGILRANYLIRGNRLVRFLVNKIIIWWGIIRIIRVGERWVNVMKDS